MYSPASTLHLAWGVLAFLGSIWPLGASCAAGGEAAKRRDFETALPLLEKCVATSTAPVESFLLLCGVYQAKGDEQALLKTALGGISRFPEEKRFYLTAGTIAARQQDYPTSVDLLDRAHKRWPDDAQVRRLLASAQFALGAAQLDKGENEAAAAALLRAVDLAPDDIEARMNLGRAQHNLLRFTEAAGTFEAVLKIQPSFPFIHFHRAMAYYAGGEFDKAADEAALEIRARPDFPPAYLVRGMAQLSNGNAEAALEDLKLASSRMPDDVSAQLSYGRALLQTGRLQEAESSLRAAIKLNPADPGPVNALATTLLRLGRAEEARALMQKASELSREMRTAKPGEIRYEDLRRMAKP